MMKEDMESNPTAPERRRHPRYLARERALVAVTGDDFGLPYHLIDISEGGLAFSHLNDSLPFLPDSRIDIYMERDLHVGRLPVTVVDDRLLGGDFIPKRRCCMRFGKLTPAQQFQLQAFINSHTRSVQPRP